MNVEQHHEDAAHRLTHEPTTPGGTTRGIPAQVGYLAAVERIEWENQGDAGWWTDSSGDLCAYPDGTTCSRSGDEYTPQQLRDQAYERLALADLAERGHEQERTDA